MDIASLTGAIQSLKAAKQLVGAAFDAKVDAEVKVKIGEAMERLGEAQEGMFELREDLHRLQNERDDLKKSLQALESWAARSGCYSLAKTHGGAVVYQFTGEPLHYACPSCFNKHEIHPLQDIRAAGLYRCTGCGSDYPVAPRPPIGAMVGSTRVRPRGY